MMEKLLKHNADSANLFISEDERLKSFKEWPFNKNDTCSIERMAEAGFYWAGSRSDLDSAACFICNKVLDGWESSDDPWEEHIKHAPQCAFAKLSKCEKELTVAEFLEFLCLAMKNRLTQQRNKLKLQIKNDIEDKRSKII